MKEYTDLNQKEKGEVLNKASFFWKSHINYVKTILKKEENITSPSGSDMFHPELWKPSHWKWFLDLMGRIK